LFSGICTYLQTEFIGYILPLLTCKTLLMAFRPSFSKCAALFCVMLPLFCNSVSRAQDYTEQKIVASDRTNVGYFGKSVAMWTGSSSTDAVTGAPDDNGVADAQVPIPSAGAVYVFRNSDFGYTTYLQKRKIYAPIRGPLDNFGASVAIYGDILVVGAPGESEDAAESNTVNGAGAVYIFKRDLGGVENWGFLKKLTAPVRSSLARFGSAVDMDATQIIVGAPGENGNAGAAYIFRKDQGGAENWGLVRKITASDPAADDSFGGTVAIDGVLAVAGAYQESQDAAGGDTRTASGSAYVFNSGQGGTENWGQVKKLTAPVRAEYDYFGFSVDVREKDILVGAPNEDESSLEVNTLNNAGSAYIFREDQGGTGNWGLHMKITAFIRMEGAAFGTSVALGPLGAFVGAPYDPRGRDGSLVTGAGAAYRFDSFFNGSSYGPGRKQVTYPRGENDAYGYAVATSGAHYIVGAFQEDGEAGPALTYPGAAYTYFVDTVIPVTLIDFNATTRENSAYLSWSTADESNSSHFEVQRSPDGRKWNTIESVKAANESRDVIHYNLTDEFPLAGQNFYRLKMVDADGTYTFSKIDKLFFEGPEFASFYPNPVTNQLRLGEMVLKNAASVRLLNQAGQVVFEKKKPVAVIETSRLNAGIYVLQIVGKDGAVRNQQVAIGK